MEKGSLSMGRKCEDRKSNMSIFQAWNRKRVEKESLIRYFKFLKMLKKKKKKNFLFQSKQ